jgi:hypothetical protein
MIVYSLTQNCHTFSLLAALLLLDESNQRSSIS